MGGIGSGPSLISKKPSWKADVITIDRLKSYNINKFLRKEPKLKTTTESATFLLTGSFPYEKKIRVSILRQPRHYGGTQAFWRCPNCERACTKLRVYNTDLVCQKCLPRTMCRYKTQRYGNLQLAKRRLLRILWKLTKGKNLKHLYEHHVERHFDCGESNYPDKPPRMRWTTYEKLMEQWDKDMRIITNSYIRAFPPNVRHLVMAGESFL